MELPGHRNRSAGIQPHDDPVASVGALDIARALSSAGCYFLQLTIGNTYQALLKCAPRWVAPNRLGTVHRADIGRDKLGLRLQRICNVTEGECCGVATVLK